MSEYVVIRLAVEDQAVEWVLVDSNGTRRSGVSSGDLEQAATAAGDHAVIVLVPAEDVLLTSVHIPARSQAKIRAALPFALEEDLADDVEDLHFAVGDRQENNRLPVAVVSREKMSRWQERLDEAGIVSVMVAAINHGLGKIAGTVGSERLRIGPGKRKLMNAPARGGGDYPVDLSYQLPGNPQSYPLCETKWQHDPASRSAAFIIAPKRGRTPRVLVFPDYREPKTKE